jgi:hypothetical protein
MKIIIYIQYGGRGKYYVIVAIKSLIIHVAATTAYGQQQNSFLITSTKKYVTFE